MVGDRRLIEPLDVKWRQTVERFRERCGDAAYVVLSTRKPGTREQAAARLQHCLDHLDLDALIQASGR